MTMTMTTIPTTTATMEMTENVSEQAQTREMRLDEPPDRRGTFASLTGLRARILGGYVLVLAVATVASLFVLRTVLLNRLDERINSALEQEVAELQTLATEGIDPRTSEPFDGDVRDRKRHV